MTVVTKFATYHFQAQFSFNLMQLFFVGFSKRTRCRWSRWWQFIDNSKENDGGKY